MSKQSSSSPLLPTPSASRQTDGAHHRGTTARSAAYLLSLFALLTLLLPSSPFSTLTSVVPGRQAGSDYLANYDAADSSRGLSCGQAEPILPDDSRYNVSAVWNAKDRIIQWHQGAIRIPTEVFDQMGEPGQDKRWDIFADLHDYLEQAYPLTHKHLKRTKVDTYGLIYEWFGSDESLQPLFLTAHQDVVPVLQATRSQWNQPPYEGVYDGEYIWGRGSSDDKSGLTSIMSSIELLLETTDFKPTRTIVLGFGHDEERGGQRGAPAIRDWLLEKYGPSSMAMLIDEGSGMATNWGRTFGLPAVAEKGKLNLNITVSTLGGHSSVPPPHTNIGLTALLVAELEKNPFPISLKQESPVWGYLQCANEYAPGMPKSLKKAVNNAQKSKKGAKALPDAVLKYGLGSTWTGSGQGAIERAMLSTTQAVDIIDGGVKVNALPEVVTTIVNHRIDVSSSIKATTEHIFATLQPVAEEFGLSMAGYGQTFEPSSGGKTAGHVSLSDAFEDGLDPAPISSTSLDNAAWRVIAGTSRGVWASRPEVSQDGKMVELPAGQDLIMAPYMSTGNTDTRRYWDFTKNIYRWRYFPDALNEGAHTINERVSADAMVEFVRFYQALILNVDASREL